MDKPLPYLLKLFILGVDKFLIRDDVQLQLIGLLEALKKPRLILLKLRAAVQMFAGFILLN